MFIEIKYLDPYLWKKHGIDKPLSTILWVLATVIVAFIIHYGFKVNYFWSYIILAFGFRFAFFNYVFNIIHDRPILYLGLNYWDRKKNAIPFPFLQVLEGFILLVAIMQFLYLGCYLYDNPYANIIFDIPKFCS